MKRLVDIYEGLLDMDADDFKLIKVEIAKTFDWVNKIKDKKELMFHEVARYSIDKNLTRHYFDELTKQQQKDFVLYMDYSFDHPGVFLINVEELLEIDGEEPEFMEQKRMPAMTKQCEKAIEDIEQGLGDRVMRSSNGFFNWAWGGLDDDYEAIIHEYPFTDADKKMYINSLNKILDGLVSLGIIDKNIQTKTFRDCKLR